MPPALLGKFIHLIDGSILGFNLYKALIFSVAYLIYHL
jgi:hypothetical protein